MKRQNKMGKGLRRWGALMLVGAALWMLARSGGGTVLRQEVQAMLEDWNFSQRVLTFQLGTGAEALEQVVLDASPALAAGMLDDLEEDSMAAEPLAEIIASEAESPSETEEAEATEETEASQETETPEETEAASENPEKTITSASGANAISLDNIYLNNSSELSVDLETVAALNTQIDLSQDGPQILIMHTHGTEAYTMDGEDQYNSSDSYRTTDDNYNMIRVGDEIAAVLEEAGFSVIHDTDLYDYPSYTGSYARAREGIQAYLEEYPTISVVLDVHRDALIADDGTTYKVVTTVDGEKTAQVMLVMGTNAGGLNHPNWQENLSFAIQIQQQMLFIDSTLPRPINLRSSRFNQDLTTGSILVEVGSCGNTLQEALRGARLFARALAETLAETLKGSE